MNCQKSTEFLASSRKESADLHEELLTQTIVRNVSHELVTPTQQAKASLALLSEEVGDSQLLEMATKAVARLERIVNDIVLLMDGGGAHQEALLLRETVDHAREGLIHKWGEAKLRERLRTRFAADLPILYADKQGVEIVLRLLLDNALKFSTGPVEIVAELLGDGLVEIAVQDWGIGMSEEQCRWLFRPFQQLDAAVTRQYGGVGVGLAIARRILAEHGAELCLESQPGHGSRFSFQLSSLARYTACGEGLSGEVKG